MRLGLEEVSEFTYFGSIVSANGSVVAELKHSVGERAKIMGRLVSLWRNREMSINLKMRMLESVEVDIVVCGSGSWVLEARERRMVDIFYMKCLRKVLGIGMMSRIRNRNMIGRCGNKAPLLERV